MHSIYACPHGLCSLCTSKMDRGSPDKYATWDVRRAAHCSCFHFQHQSAARPDFRAPSADSRRSWAFSYCLCSKKPMSNLHLEGQRASGERASGKAAGHRQRHVRLQIDRRSTCMSSIAEVLLRATQLVPTYAYGQREFNPPDVIDLAWVAIDGLLARSKPQRVHAIRHPSSQPSTKEYETNRFPLPRH